MAQVVRYWPHTADLPGFSPRPVCMGFVVDKVALGRATSGTSVLPRYCYFTCAPYFSIPSPLTLYVCNLSN
jgi:hypothetical protein